jgi:hypothetical protein
MSLSYAEQEIIIRIARDEDVVTCTSTDAVWNRKLVRLAEKFGVPVVKLSSVTIQVKLPRDQVSLLLPKRRVTLSDDQRVAMAERMAKVRESSPTRSQESST